MNLNQREEKGKKQGGIGDRELVDREFAISFVWKDSRDPDTNCGCFCVVLGFDGISSVHTIRRSANTSGFCRVF
jgi:hypothetical protein